MGFDILVPSQRFHGSFWSERPRGRPSFKGMLDEIRSLNQKQITEMNGRSAV